MLRAANIAVSIIFGAIWIALSPFGTAAQSTDRLFPTALTTNEIRGTIEPRAIGDSRLTTYYYIFNGERGDVFINVVTTNLNGDIDIFTADGLNPRTKITIYADSPVNETGRVVYMRRAERLILRIQGRPPNDDPATYEIKFAGSFSPITDASASSEAPVVTGDTAGSVNVNEVGTIIEPAPVEDPAEEDVEADDDVAAVDPSVRTGETEKPAATETVKPKEDAGRDEAKTDEAVAERPDETPRRSRPVVVVTDDLEVPDKVDPPAEDAKEAPAKEMTVEITPKTGDNVSALVTIERAPPEDEAAEDKGEEVESKAPANPLAAILLRIETKDGKTYERPMSEVISVNVVRGVLTIVSSDGKVIEFGILDVKRMSIGGIEQ